jgi:hypothetical protein
MLSILRVMAITPHGSWSGCPHFGLRELSEQAANRSEVIQLAVKEINRALDDLGIVNFQVEGIKAESIAGAGVSEWTVTVVSRQDPTKTYSFNWRPEQ